MRTTASVHGVPIRLPDERWIHICEEHAEVRSLLDDVLLAVSRPKSVHIGANGELLAATEMEPGKYLIVAYKESENGADGFIITAFLTRRMRSIERRIQIWP